jgi:hypothetical protein
MLEGNAEGLVAVVSCGEGSNDVGVEVEAGGVIMDGWREVD